MDQIYFSLSLKRKQKTQKVVNIRWKNDNLPHLNQILKSTLKNFRLIKSQKGKSPVKILKLLDKIIPDEYFGTTPHRKLFYRVVKIILTQSAFECIHYSTIIKGYNYNAIPWLNDVKSAKICAGLLMQMNKFLLERVVKPLITFYYKPVRTYNRHEIKFVRLENWTSFEAKVINQLKKSNFLVEVTNGAVEPTGYLKIVPKGALEDGNFRAIVGTFRRSKTDLHKLLTKKIYEAANEMNVHFSASLHNDWASFVQRTSQKLFGVKLDVKDAYGNIDTSVLCTLVQGLPTKFLSSEHKAFVIKHIQNQCVAFKRKVFRWNHGLVQGDTLSACLCELYMTFLDKLFLSEFDSDRFMHRSVDDYFFCSTEEHKVDHFISTIQSFHQINATKTKSNLFSDGTEEIPFCGKLFNLATREVKTLYSFSDGYEIRHRFKFWNFYKPIPENECERFVRKTMAFSFSNNCFSKLEMNTTFNCQRTVLENFFDGMVYVAYKFDAVLMAVKNNSLVEDLHFVYPVLESCIREYGWRVLKKIRQCRGAYYKKPITFKLLRVLAYKAFIVVFKRRNEVYKDLIVHIKSENKLIVSFSDSNLDFRYFNKLPVGLRHVLINRKNIL